MAGVQVQHHTAERRAGSCFVRHPLSDFELRWVENTSSGGHTTPADVTSLSYRSGLGPKPAYCCPRDCGNHVVIYVIPTVPFLPKLLFVDFSLTINRVSCCVVSSSMVMLTDVSERCLRGARCDKDLAVAIETWFSR
jgi:hypothetical protein